ncbi:hypothetical protein ACJ72_06844, partial [Emergomyces africanus]
MRLSHVFVATVIIAGDIALTGAAEIDCANNCFQTAVNNNGCDKWLSDPECCQSKVFLSSIASCISGACSRSASDEAWAHLAAQCDKVAVSIPSDYTELPSPRDPSSTTKSTTSTTSTTSTSTSNTSSPTTETTTTSTTETLPTGSPIAGAPTVGQSATPTSSTANPGGSDPPNEDNRSDGSGGLSTAAKVAIGVTALFFIFCLLVAFIFWLRQRRKKKVTPSSTETQDNEAQEIKPLVYEMPGTEISRHNGMYEFAAELEAVDTSRGGGGGGGGGSTLPMPDVGPTLFLSPILNSDNQLDDHTKEVRELNAGADHTGSLNKPSKTPPPPLTTTAGLPITSSTSPTMNSSPPASPPIEQP